jgi:hypothetical protein
VVVDIDSTPILIGNNETYWTQKDITYYISKPTDYIVAIVIVGVLSVMMPLLFIICCRYSSKETT